LLIAGTVSYAAAGDGASFVARFLRPAGFVTDAAASAGAASP